MILAFWLMVSHYLCDYPLQSDFMARGKADRTPGAFPWWHLLIAHCQIHGGGVALAVGLCSGSWTLAAACGLSEMVAHFAIDDAKCRGKTNIHQDQALHLACKVAIAAVVWGIQ